MKKVVYSLALLFSTACTHQPIVIERVPFKLSEFANLARTGDATVTGQAYIKTANGRIHYPENVDVRLNPKTSYSTQWYEVNYLGKQNISDADPRYLEYVYKVPVGNEGRFSFNNIPAGDYYISAPVFWFEKIPKEDGSILLQRRGSFICYELHVDKGNTVVANITTEQAVKVASSL